MKEEIKIIYQHYVPEKLIYDFGNSAFKIESELELKKIKQNQNVYNFSGFDIPDIIIFIERNSIELIAGLFLTITYDMFKSSLKLLWTEISKLDIKILKAKGKPSDKPKIIIIRISGNDKSVEIIFEGNVNSEQAETVIRKAFEFLYKEKVEEVFKNPEFIQTKLEKPRIRIKYNKEREIWEPENFESYRRFVEQIEKSSEKLSS